MTEPIQRDIINGVSTTDDLPNELIALLHDAGIKGDAEQKLMLQLLPFIVRRDHQVFNHAYQVGRASV